MQLVLFILTLSFSFLSSMIRNQEIKDDVHLSNKKSGFPRALEVFGSYPVLAVAFAFSLLRLALPLAIFVLIVGAVASLTYLLVEKVVNVDFWKSKKQIVDLVSVALGLILFIYMVV